MSFANIEIEQSSNFLKPKSGEVITFHIMSESPLKENVHWVNKARKPCLGKNCEYCFEGNAVKQRWICDVYDRKDRKAKKFEFGPFIAGQLKEIAAMLAETNQTIHDVDIRIKTTGSGVDTEYSVLHVASAGPVPKDAKVSSEGVPF